MNSALERALLMTGTVSPQETSHDQIVDCLADLLLLATAAGFDRSQLIEVAVHHADRETPESGVVGLSLSTVS